VSIGWKLNPANFTNGRVSLDFASSYKSIAFFGSGRVSYVQCCWLVVVGLTFGVLVVLVLFTLCNCAVNPGFAFACCCLFYSWRFVNKCLPPK
jgi:hypothetical protein